MHHLEEITTTFEHTVEDIDTKPNNMLNQAFIAELKHEAASTKRILKRVPEGKFDWKSHEKSMRLGWLTSHVAGLPGFLNFILTMDEFDFAKAHYKPSHPKTPGRTNERFSTKIR